MGASRAAGSVSADCESKGGGYMDESLERVERLSQEIDELVAHGEYARAYPLSCELLEASSAAFGESDVRLARALNDAAAVERYLGKFEDGEEHFLAAACILRAVRGERDSEYATTVNNLAGLYRLMGRLDDAEREFSRALSIYREVLPESDWRTISCYNNLGLLFQDQGRFEEALGCHERAFELLRLGAGEEHPNSVATTLMNTAVCCARMGQTQRASELFDRALAMTLELNGEVSASYAGALNNVASFRVSQGDFVAAIELLERSRDIAARLFGIDARAYQLVVSNLERVREMAASS